MQLQISNLEIVAVELPEGIKNAWNDSLLSAGETFQEHVPYDAFIAEAVKQAWSALSLDPLATALEDLKEYRTRAVIIRNCPVGLKLPSAR